MWKNYVNDELWVIIFCLRILSILLVKAGCELLTWCRSLIVQRYSIDTSKTRWKTYWNFMANWTWNTRRRIYKTTMLEYWLEPVGCEIFGPESDLMNSFQTRPPPGSSIDIQKFINKRINYKSGMVMILMINLKWNHECFLLCLMVFFYFGLLGDIFLIDCKIFKLRFNILKKNWFEGLDWLIGVIVNLIFV